MKPQGWVSRRITRATNNMRFRFQTCVKLGGAHTKSDNAGEMSSGSSTESYPAFARIRLRENLGKASTRKWTARRSEEKRLEVFEMWIWRMMERVKWTDRIRNEAVLERVGKERIMLKLIRKRKRNWLDHWLRRNCLLKDRLKERNDPMSCTVQISREDPCEGSLALAGKRRGYASNSASLKEQVDWSGVIGRLVQTMLGQWPAGSVSGIGCKSEGKTRIPCSDLLVKCGL
ncbi:hypothetical protein ANN_02629 [Periplaneta americana]|uniref:Uncharacterized protein n=1 Tax=Periplaneta americana TaxID=6978 RepID=A0ABQ8TZS6_PERAM|nr:hypothetical protein ANN_02629 [Periplaneta americana]